MLIFIKIYSLNEGAVKAISFKLVEEDDFSTWAGGVCPKLGEGAPVFRETFSLKEMILYFSNLSQKVDS